MSTIELVTSKLNDILKPQNAQILGPGAIRIEELRANLSIALLQETLQDVMALIITEVTVSFDDVDSRITITCVGMTEGLEQACELAMRQWAIGVLPVLCVYRGAHTCLAEDDGEFIAGHSGRFKLLSGPIIELGSHTGEQKPLPDEYAIELESLLENEKLRRRLHWVEAYANRMGPGHTPFISTCRLDNRDWLPGQNALLSLAQSWPGQVIGLHSRRQFFLLVPEGEGAYEKTPGFWGRMMGKR